MSKATWRYFSTPALNTVGPNLPPHLTQIPFNGARRGFQLHFEHLDLCDVNVRRLPTKSRRMWVPRTDRKSTRLNSSHDQISYAVFCLKKKKKRVRYTVSAYCSSYLS